jgi:hypothetical protein
MMKDYTTDLRNRLIQQAMESNRVMMLETEKLLRETENVIRLLSQEIEDLKASKGCIW